MLRFDTDYMEGAHPAIMQRLLETNLEHTVGYGFDEYTQRAKELVRKACGDEDLDVTFLVGGTQTNAVMIDALLDKHEGVLACETAHIFVHEAGAIEFSGHKVLALPSHNGKVDPDEVSAYIDNYYADDAFEHMVAPGMLYITYPTEYGTVYTREELEKLQAICRKASIPMYIDGARLGYGLAREDCDITLEDLPRLCDAFYIGGTKVGALFGECAIARKGLLKHFFSLVKQHGALVAKGRILGIQFETLMSNDLYMEISRHAVTLAMKIKNAFISKGFTPYLDSPTNQQFFALPNEVVDTLLKKATFEYWGPRGEKSSVVRFVTSWATEEDDVDEFVNYINTIL